MNIIDDGGSHSLALREGEGLSVRASFDIDGQGGGVVTIDYALLDAVGATLAEGSLAIEAHPNASTHHALIVLPAKMVREDFVWDALLDLGEAVALQWRIELLGEADQLLARKSLWARYRQEDLISTSPKPRRLKAHEGPHQEPPSRPVRGNVIRLLPRRPAPR